jgi:hypothetical protein
MKIESKTMIHKPFVLTSGIDSVSYKDEKTRTKDIGLLSEGNGWLEREEEERGENQNGEK